MQTKHKVTAKGLWEVLKKTFAGFSRDNVMKLSASLAYYTIVTIGPLLIVIVSLANLIWKQGGAQQTILTQVSNMAGASAAKQVEQILTNAQVQGNSTLAAVVGIAALILGATTVFTEMQDSLDKIWNLKVKPQRGWLIMLIKRLLSFSMVISMCLLLLVSLVVNAALDILFDRLQSIFPDVAVVVMYALNLLVTLVVIGFLFALIFKLLPDAKIRWRDVLPGALFTAILFAVARIGIAFYLGRSNVASAYGAAGSLIVMLLWIYYTSVVLYLGAEFTKAYTMKYGADVTPNKFAVTVRVMRAESGHGTVQENEALNDEAEEEEVQKSKRRQADRGEQQRPSMA